MAGRILLKKFGIVNSNTVETPVRLYPYFVGAYSAFTNQYGVWNTSTATGTKLTATRKFTAPTTGTYKIRATVDNSGSVYIDGNKIAGTPQNYNATPTAVSVTLTAGEHILRFEVINTGGPGCLACTISDSTDTQVLWDTRTYAVVYNITSSVYVMTPTFAGTITAHIWGGGGGGGSADSGVGGSGSPGLYKTLTFNFNKGDTIEVAIGSGGSEGISGRPQIGGAGGPGRINVDGSSSRSFNGGTGGDGPVSGAGGGGGGATTILVNNQLVLAAGGGGGGGGAGSKGNSQNGKSASINFNAIGSTSSDYRGQNGQTRASDGGTGGGGGGGYPGGLGGKSNSGDSGAEPGQTGGNYPSSSAARGEGSTYYESSYGAAGSPSAPGQDGYAVLEILPAVQYAAASAVKVAGDWRQIAKGYVKVSGTWRQIITAYVKKNGTWRPIVSAGAQDSVTETASITNYGQVQRSY